MKLDLYQRVALRHDLPAHHLKRGDVATLVDYVPHPGDGEDGYVLEVFNAVGQSMAVIAVPMSAVAPLRANEVLSVRALESEDRGEV
jgi:hypothetical protein